MPAEIRSVANGYVVNFYGNDYVAKTLVEAAEIVGEAIPQQGKAVYADGKHAGTLAEVRLYAMRGDKISAIKLLRDCFTTRLNLREAKDLVEQLCGI